jgi:hypothetical protein
MGSRRNGRKDGKARVRAAVSAVFAVLAATLIPSCSSHGKTAQARYDPCKEMKKEGENVSQLQHEIEDLSEERNAASKDNDSAKVESLNAKLERKTELMQMNKVALQKASENCDAEMKSLHRYPESPRHRNSYP